MRLNIKKSFIIFITLLLINCLNTAVSSPIKDDIITPVHIQKQCNSNIKNITDIPSSVFTRILDYTNISDILILRKTSKFFQEQIGHSPRWEHKFIMPFKIGFEFQEVHNLCPWARNNYNIQKKPLFNLLLKENVLWSLVIDGSDIEFVLMPFSRTQKEQLTKAVEGVNLCCNVLTTLFNTDKPAYTIQQINDALNLTNLNDIQTLNPIPMLNSFGSILFKAYGDDGFAIWKKWIFSQKDEEFFQNSLVKTTEQELKDQLLKSSNPRLKVETIINNAFKIANSKSIQYIKPEASNPEITFQDWIERFKTHLPKDYSLVEIENENKNKVLDSVRKLPLKKIDKIEFQPQVTIQYPLEYTIPLWFTLFGFEQTTEMQLFLSCLPFLDNIKEKDDLKELFSKENGLIFLHAQTLFNMKPSSLDDKDQLANLLMERLPHGQVDAKGKIHLMSRRPFSSMWSQINQLRNSNQRFTEMYITSMQKNKRFYSGAYNVPETFNKSDYAEILLDPANGRPQNLTFLLQPENETIFLKDFLMRNNSAETNYIKSLLEKGILATTMIRNFDPDKVKILNREGQILLSKTPLSIFEEYYNETLASVDEPKKRFSFNLEQKTLIEETFKYDALSPPWFLALDDSMGYMKDESKIDPQYGEAIIEVRKIQNVGLFFLNIRNKNIKANKNQKIESRKSYFLRTLKEQSLENDAENLFLFLFQVNNYICSEEFYDKMLNYISKYKN